MLFCRGSHESSEFTVIQRLDVFPGKLPEIANISIDLTMFTSEHPPSTSCHSVNTNQTNAPSQNSVIGAMFTIFRRTNPNNGI